MQGALRRLRALRSALVVRQAKRLLLVQQLRPLQSEKAAGQCEGLRHTPPQERARAAPSAAQSVPPTTTQLVGAPARVCIRALLESA